jgi:SAM-dependent methyltransferase
LTENPNQLDEDRRYWNDAAAAFDEAPDHGLHDPQLRAAWTALLADWLPAGYHSVLDVGCGTGSLSSVLSCQGHRLTGIDFAPAMLNLARAKVAEGQFFCMDAAEPDLPAGSFDGLISRHLLWALPEPALVLKRWAGLLRPGGRLVLVEGVWAGCGLPAADVLKMLPKTFGPGLHVDLSDRPILWGRPVDDERYAIIADLGV